MRRSCRGLPGLLACILATACATYDASYPKSPSKAFRDAPSTHLGRLFAEQAAARPGRSGVDAIRYGRVAFTARLAIADQAERSLDLQYYIWDADITGRLLGERLVRAADRGVRVRVLLDDNSIVGRDTALAQLSGHPNIEIRSFNPYRDRRRWRDLFTEPSRINRRSHNKILVADGAVAILGGRNIADHYYGVHGGSNSRDLDMMAVGAVVPDVSSVFDAFWNSSFAVPYGAFVDDVPTPEQAEVAAAALRARMGRGSPAVPGRRGPGEAHRVPRVHGRQAGVGPDPRALR
jgi:putative cardiolipin synthase